MELLPIIDLPTIATSQILCGNFLGSVEDIKKFVLSNLSVILSS